MYKFAELKSTICCFFRIKDVFWVGCRPSKKMKLSTSDACTEVGKAPKFIKKIFWKTLSIKLSNAPIFSSVRPLEKKFASFS